MRLLNAVCAAAVVAAAFSLAPEASAQRNRNQATTVVVVNYQRIVAESALGRDLAAKLEQVRTQIGTEAQALAPEGQSIEQEQARLQNSLRNQTQDQLRSNPQVQALAQRATQYQQRARGLEGDMQCSQAVALRDFDRQISPVIRSIMESRGAGVVLDSRNTQLSLPEYDITTTVIQQLDQNQATRTAAVTRRPVAECQGQAAAPAAAPGQ